MIEVFLVDDHPIIRQGFAQMLAAEPDLTLCGQAADAPSALAQLGGATPDIVIVDVSLGDTSGIDLIRELKLRWPRLAVLVFSMHDERLYAERALRAGAAGYVMKHEPADVILRAIRTVVTGGVAVSSDVSGHFLQRWVASGPPSGGSPLDALSDRELHVLGLIGKGLGTRAIAESLHVSVKTIESYRARLKEKMNLRTGTELMQFAVHWAARA